MTKGPTHYDILGIQQSASQAEVKAAYRHVLLSSHPDKKTSSCNTSECWKEFDVAPIQDAYRILSDGVSRAAYDASLGRHRSSIISSSCLPSPRPAQVVSLEEFSCMDSRNSRTWIYGCRCGGLYSINELDMEEDRHLIGCLQCSEVVYVGYEVLPEDEEVVERNRPFAS